MITTKCKVFNFLSLIFWLKICSFLFSFCTCGDLPGQGSDMSVRLSPSIKNLFLPLFILAAICLTPRVAQVEMLLRKIAHKYFIFMRFHSQANKLLLRQPQCFNRLLVFRFRTHTLFDCTEETKTWSICQAASKTSLKHYQVSQSNWSR